MRGPEKRVYRVSWSMAADSLSLSGLGARTQDKTTMYIERVAQSSD